MQSYNGIVVSPNDAITLLEAASQGIIPSVLRRLTDFERISSIKSGAVFVWEENSSKIKRWTEGRKWSASRVSGVFLTYKEMQPLNSDHSTAFKYSGLIKQSFSVFTKDGRNLHLVSYLDNSYLDSNNKKINEGLMRPSLDPKFKGIVIDISQYPEGLVENTSFKQIEKRKLDEDITHLNERFLPIIKRRKSSSSSTSTSTISLISSFSMPHSPLSSEPELEPESESESETFSKLLEFTTTRNRESQSVSSLPIDLIKSNSPSPLGSISSLSEIIPSLPTKSPPLSRYFSKLLNIDNKAAVSSTTYIHRSLVNEDDKLLGYLDKHFI